MNCPPTYWELANTVENYLTRGSRVEGWSVDATEEVAPDKVGVFPFAKDGAVGAHVVYLDSKSNVTGRVDVSSATSSAKDLLPKLSYTTKREDTVHTADVDLRTSCINYTFMHPVLFGSWRWYANKGISGVGAVSARWTDNLLFGTTVRYDALRSGLTDMTLLAVHQRSRYANGGDLVGTYTLRDGVGVQVRVPLHPYMDASVIASKNRFVAGVLGRSPCGAAMMLNTNVTERTYTVTAIRNLNDIWKMTVSWTAPLSKAGAAGGAPRFGIKFSNDSMLE